MVNPHNTTCQSVCNAMNQNGMRGAVRELYKRLLFAGRSYPQGINHVREKVKAGKQLELIELL